MRLSTLSCLAAVALATATACLPARAVEWTQLPGPATSGVVVYTDLGSERSRHGRILGYLLPNPRQAWFVTDYTTPHRWKLFQIASSKQRMEFDCKRSSMRVLTRLYYAGAMAQGRLLASETPAADFTPIIPGDVEEAMYQSACRPPVEETQQAAQSAPAAPAAAMPDTPASPLVPSTPPLSPPPSPPPAAAPDAPLVAPAAP